jgi:hypothetical protein
MPTSNRTKPPASALSDPEQPRLKSAQANFLVRFQDKVNQ